LLWAGYRSFLRFLEKGRTKIAPYLNEPLYTRTVRTVV